ncbi:unnamed protein product [Peronospora belbahrii]|nr:unnamed protein product [Peronospora belbahrii]
MTESSFVTILDSDSDDEETYMLNASPDGLTLNVAEFYLNSEKFDWLNDAFHAYVMKLLLLIGVESHEAASNASAVIAFEKTVTAFSVAKDEPGISAASNNRISVTQATSMHPLLISQFLDGAGLLQNLTGQKAEMYFTV